MPGTKEFNSDVDIKGKIIVTTVPNNTGTVVTYNSTTKELSTRSNTDIISDLSLMTTNTAQNVTGRKSFYSTGTANNETTHTLWVRSDDATDPGITFWKNGSIGSTIRLNTAGYHFGMGSTNVYHTLNAGRYNVAAPYREVSNTARFFDIISLANANLFTYSKEVWNGNAWVSHPYPTINVGESAGSNGKAGATNNMGAFAGQNASGNYNNNFGISSGQLSQGNHNNNLGTSSFRYGFGSHNFNALQDSGLFAQGNQNIHIGLSSSSNNRSDNTIALGSYTNLYNANAYTISQGNEAGRFNTGYANIGFGYLVNRYAQGNNNHVIGHNSNQTFKANVGGNKNFDYTAIDIVARTITIPSHNFGSVGEYRNLLFTQGTSVITGLPNTAIIQVKIIDSNTLLYSELMSSGQYRHTHNITNAGTGTGHTFTPQFTWHTINIFGSGLEPTKGGQNIISGGEFLMPQSTVGTLDADTTNKTLITKEWFLNKNGSSILSAGSVAASHSAFIPIALAQSNTPFVEDKSVLFGDIITMRGGGGTTFENSTGVGNNMSSFTVNFKNGLWSGSQNTNDYKCSIITNLIGDSVADSQLSLHYATIGGIKYIGFKILGTPVGKNVYLKGYMSKPELFKVYLYYYSTTNTVLNSEINDSIVPAPTQAGVNNMYYNGRKIITDSDFNPANYALANHTHRELVDTTSFLGNVNTLYEDYKTKFIHKINSSATNLFQTVNNANAVLSIAKHEGGYGTLLGFNGNGDTFVQNISANAHQGWKQFAYRDWVTTQLVDYVKTSDTVKVTITGITQDVIHNFNTYDIVCEAYDTSTLYNLPIKYKRKNLNTVTIEFDNPVPNSVRLMITKK